MDVLLRRGVETTQGVLCVFTKQARVYLAIEQRVYQLDQLILVGTNSTKLILHFAGGACEVIIFNESETITLKFAEMFRTWLRPFVRALCIDVL